MSLRGRPKAEVAEGARRSPPPPSCGLPSLPTGKGRASVAARPPQGRDGRGGGPPIAVAAVARPPTPSHGQGEGQRRRAAVPRPRCPRGRSIAPAVVRPPLPSQGDRPIIHRFHPTINPKRRDRHAGGRVENVG